MLAACGGDDDTGGSITIAESAQPDALDPAMGNTLNGWETMWLVYTPLLTYRHAEGQSGTELIPGLAEELPGDLGGRKDLPPAPQGGARRTPTARR